MALDHGLPYAKLVFRHPHLKHNSTKHVGDDCPERAGSGIEFFIEQNKLNIYKPASNNYVFAKGFIKINNFSYYKGLK